MKKHLLRLLAFVLLGVCYTGLDAQVTTSGINGTITDAATKETLIGASVVAKHIPTGTVYGVATNVKGNFNLQGLRPGGPYTIEISYIGYQTVVMNNVMLSLGDTETINVKLKDDSKALEQVVVTGSRSHSLNATRTGAASSFNRTAIDRTPSVSRSVMDIAKLTPQANVTSSGISFAGSSNKYNSFQIDGTVNNDVFGLSSSGTNGGQSGANPISLEAIDALQVVIAPFDVRQGGFTGGGINAITKSGSNTWKGSAYDYFHNQDFYGTTSGADVAKRKKLDKQFENTVGFTLGGPIIKDKLFFFVNGEYVDRNTQTSFNVGDGSAIEAKDIDPIIEHIKKISGGYDGGGYAKKDIPTTNYKALARIDWNINQAHRLNVRYSYVQGSRFNFGRSRNQLRLNDNGYTMNNKTHSLVTELNSTFGSNMNNEFRFGYTRVRDFRTPDGKPFPHVQVNIDDNRSILFGTERFSMANRLDQDIFTLTNNFNWNIGDHALTFGTHNELFQMQNLFIRENYGSYRYDTLDKFFKIGTPQEEGPDQYDYSFADVNVTKDPRYAPAFKAAQLGFYVQDDWKVSSKLRLTLGLRMDLPLFFEQPRANDKFNGSDIAKQYGVQNHTMPQATPLWSPRFGFRYQIDEERRFLLRGGAGIFTGRIPFVWVSNSFSNTGLEFTRLRLSGKGAKDLRFNPDVNSQFAQTRTSEIDLITKNFKFPQVARFNLAFEALLPGDVKAVVEGMYTHNLNNIVVRNLNYRATDKTLKQGSLERPLYEQVDGKNFSDIILLDNTNKGYTYNVTTTLSKDFAFGLSASIAYTYGRAMSVNDGASSQAKSTWEYNQGFYGDKEHELYLSNFDMRHRIVGNLSYRVEYAKHFATTIGLIYNGQSGNRFSVVTNGDLNGDGARGNDLLYVPTDAEIDAMPFTKRTTFLPSTKKTIVLAEPEEQKQQFKEFINNNPEIAKHRGTFIERNGLVTPFVNQIDFHFAQDFFLNVGGRRHTLQLNADVINLGNLFNRAWGQSYYVQYDAINPLGFRGGKYTFTPLKNLWEQANIDSRWRAQIGVKYIF